MKQNIYCFTRLFFHLPKTAGTQVPDVYETLCHLDPCSGVGKIGLGWSLLVGQNYVDALPLLKEGKRVNKYQYNN